MPFACSAEGGRLTVKPVADLRRYAIVGNRAEQPVTVCRNAESSDCRTIMVHRFHIACGAERVAWMRVAAELRGRFGRSWIEAGRLNLTLVARRGAGAPQGCDQPPHHLISASASDGAQVLAGECLPWRRRRTDDVIALPPGFAPIGEMGARLSLPTPPDPGVMLAADAGLGMASASEAPVAPEPALLRSDGQVASWVTVVAPESGGERSGLGPGLPILAVAFTVALGLAALGWTTYGGGGLALPNLAGGVSRLRRAWPAWRERFGVDGPSAAPFLRETAGSGAAENIAAHLAQARLAVAGLRTAAPLREVLENELQTIQQRVAVVAATASEGREAGRRAAPAIRALIRDLERIRRIAESAGSALPGTRESLRMPGTRAEAYDLLGVNPEVSEATLKKIVDALRMSWHPDLGRSEEDRRLREERTKQINVAWDLIQAKRASA